MSRQVIRKLWEGFEQRAVAAVAPEVPRREMRLAFYSGVSAMAGINVGLSQYGVTRDDAVIIWATIGEELRQFAANYEGDKRCA